MIDLQYFLAVGAQVRCQCRTSRQAKLNLIGWSPITNLADRTSPLNMLNALHHQTLQTFFLVLLPCFLASFLPFFLLLLRRTTLVRAGRTSGRYGNQSKVTRT